MLPNNEGEKYATGVTTSKIRARDNIINYWHLERDKLANGRQIRRIVIPDEQVPLEHLRSLRGTMEKLWRNIHSGGS